jgi:uncharacterized protein YkwD
MKKGLSTAIHWILVCCLVILTGISSCSNKPPAKPVVRAAPASPAPAIEQDILYLINRHREANKLPSLIENTTMAAEARQHSIDMASHRIAFGHDGLDSRTKIITAHVKGVTQVGENVAFGSMTAQQVVDAWLNSPNHRRNIEGVYRFTGIGVARDSRSRLYFTQIFAK